MNREVNSIDQVVVLESQTQSQKKDKKQHYDHFFESGVFDEYFQGLKKFTTEKSQKIKKLNENNEKSLFVDEVMALISTIDTTARLPNEKRTLHENIIKQLRALIKSKESFKTEADEEVKEAIQFIDQICSWMFSEVDVSLSLTNIFTKIEPSEFKNETISNQSVVENINKILAVLKSNPILKKGSNAPIGHKNEDLHLEGYIPSKIFDANGTKFILAPRPTIGAEAKDGSIPLMINSEFLNFLRTLKSQGKKYLYVNVMDRSTLGYERALSLLLENLSKDPEFKDVIDVLSLDRSTKFYWLGKDKKDPKGETEKGSEQIASEFKQMFMDRLFDLNDQTNGFHWPEKYDIADWKMKIRKILEEVHQTHFGNKENLSKEERQDFIEIAEVNFIKYICLIEKPEYAQISCKVTADRGPSLMALVYAENLIKTRTPITLSEKLKIITILLAPPLTHNRNAHLERIDRFGSAFMAITNSTSRILST